MAPVRVIYGTNHGSNGNERKHCGKESGGSWKWRKRQSFLLIFGSDGQARNSGGQARNSDGKQGIRSVLDPLCFVITITTITIYFINPSGKLIKTEIKK